MSCLLVWMLSLAPTLPQQTVICIGDSITAGEGGGEQAAWPELLEQRLGGAAKVIALGASSATLLRGTDRPYLETAVWRDAPRVAADVAIVMLGTNDTILNAQRQPWERVDQLNVDALALLESIRTRTGAGRVLLCSPPPMFADKAGLSESRAADLSARAPRAITLAVRYRDIAATQPAVEFVDLARTLVAGRTVDGVHPDPFGALAIAERLAAVLRCRPEPDAPRISELLRARNIEPKGGDYHGFSRLDFALPEGGPACVIVRPDFVSAGVPWIWRARFFGHEPALDLALLDRGFHLVYVDVSDLYGAPPAVRRWEQAFELLRELGLADQPILHGLSRGGLPVLNFALAHPGWVGAVLLDNAVCDFRSWPGGRNGAHSEADWQRLLRAYDIDAAQAWEHDGPLGRLEPVAERDVPLFLLLSGADEVVPPAENGELLIARYRALGGSAQVWRKPGAGHHPHGLRPVAPLVRALLRATHVDPTNPATVAVPSVEFRGAAAGWGPGGSWDQQLSSMRELARAHPEIETVFLGDSITQGLTGAVERMTQSGGARPIDRFANALDLGLSGDRTEHLLYRIQHGALELIDPAWIVLQIGANNINAARHTGFETAEGLAAVVQLLLTREPQAQILLCGPFPIGREPHDARRAAVELVHQRAQELAQDPRVQHLDLRTLFLDANGRAGERMRSDALHINAAGQASWMEALEASLGESTGGR